MPSFQPFVMEREMSRWEHRVEVNLSESGVHPLTLAELMTMAGRDVAELGELGLSYGHANGSPALREHIANLYPGASADEVLVTVGAAEANFLALTTLVGPGDEIVVVLPNYLQAWGIAHNVGASVREVYLRAADGWALDTEALDAAVTPRTRMICVCNPNNPTGRILSEAEMDAVVAAAERADAWLLADEVYRGAERERDDETPTFHGRTDRVIAQGSMSKAYGLPGLRIGWSVAPADLVEAMWRRHDYVAITPPLLSDHLTTLALSPQVRPSIIARTRALIRGGFGLLSEWIGEQGGTFRVTPPDAAAIALLAYDLPIESSDWVERLRTEHGLLIVPGSHFGVERHVRVSFAVPEAELLDGLARVSASVSTLRG